MPDRYGAQPPSLEDQGYWRAPDQIPMVSMKAAGVIRGEHERCPATHGRLALTGPDLPAAYLMIDFDELRT